MLSEISNLIPIILYKKKRYPPTVLQNRIANVNAMITCLSCLLSLGLHCLKFCIETVVPCHYTMNNSALLCKAEGIIYEYGNLEILPKDSNASPDDILMSSHISSIE